MKIGVGIVTYQRFDRFKECFEHLLKNNRDVDEILIVEDCSVKDRERYDEYFKSILLNNVNVIRNSENKGVGYCKNLVMKYFYGKNFEFIFTLEDDINVVNPGVFMHYVDTGARSGIHYLNFGLHGPANVGKKQLKKHGDAFVWVFPESVGAFTMYTNKLIEVIGYHDESFLNAWEHVEYAYRASNCGLSLPFWQFADAPLSDTYLNEQVGSLEDSSIRPREDWKPNIKAGYDYFK